MLKELSVVGRVIDFFRVQQDLVKLPKLGERGYDLVGDVCSKVDGESELSIGNSDEISKFLTTFKLSSAPSSSHHIVQ